MSLRKKENKLKKRKRKNLEKLNYGLELNEKKNALLYENMLLSMETKKLNSYKNQLKKLKIKKSN